jgi:hypothetical protein
VEAYVVRASNGAQLRISNENFWKYAYVKFSNLPNGQPLTFTVSAVNGQGTSQESLPSRPVTPNETPIDLPAAPENVSVHPGKGAVSIHFQLPPANHSQGAESPILAYAVSINPGGRKVLFTGRNIVVLEGKHVTFNVVDGLTSGASYTFNVSAVNNAGEGAPATVGPVTLP